MNIRKTVLIAFLMLLSAESAHASFASRIACIIGGCTLVGGCIALCTTDDYASSQRKTDNTICGGLIGAAVGGICSLFVDRTDQEEIEHANEHYLHAQSLYERTMREFSEERTLATMNETALKRIINKHRHGLYHYLDYVESLRTTLNNLESEQSTLDNQISTLEKRTRKLRKRRSMDADERQDLTTHYTQCREKTENLCAQYTDLIGNVENILAAAQSLDGYQHDRTQKSLDETQRELARTRWELQAELRRPSVVVHACHHEPHCTLCIDPHDYHAHHHHHGF